MKTLTNVAIQEFNPQEINLDFDLDGVGYFATLSIVSHTFEIIDESFAHEFGIKKAFSYEFDAKLCLTYLEDENGVKTTLEDGVKTTLEQGVETTLDEDVLVSLKNIVLEEMQEQEIQKMYEIFN